MHIALAYMTARVHTCILCAVCARPIKAIAAWQRKVTAGHFTHCRRLLHTSYGTCYNELSVTSLPLTVAALLVTRLTIRTTKS